jgi:hypothetical protein
VFAERGTDMIENKIVLVARRHSDLTTPEPLGQGGLDDGIYVFALLDWEAPARAHRRCYLQPSTAAVIQRRMDEMVGVNL